MAEMEKGFSLEIPLNAVLTHKDGTAEDVDDTGSIVDIFKEVSLLQTHLKEATYFHLQGVSCPGEEVLLKCCVFSDAELKDLNQSIKSGDLAKKLTEYACEYGLEVKLGQPPGGSKTQLVFELDLKGKLFRQGIAFFKAREEQKEQILADSHKGFETKTNSGKRPSKSNAEVKEKEFRNNDEMRQRMDEGSLATDKKSKEESSSGKNQLKSWSKDDDTGKRKIECEAKVSVDKKNNNEKSDGRMDDSSMSLSGANNNMEHLDGKKKQKLDGDSLVTSKTAISSTDKDLAEPKIGRNGEMGKTSAGSEVAPESLNLQKEVIVYLHTTAVKNKNIVEVSVEIKANGTRIALKKLTPLENNIWTSGRLEFAPENEELECQIRLKYWRSMWISQTLSTYYYSWTKIGSSDKIYLICEAQSTEEGFSYYLINILKNVKSCGLKEAIMQVDYLTNLFLSCDRNGDIIFGILESFVEKQGFACSYLEFGLLGYVYGRLVFTGHSLIVSKFVTQPICEAILKSLQVLSENDLPNNTLQMYENIVETLCVIAFPRGNCHFFSLLKYCFPLFPMSYFSKVLESHRTSVSSLMESEFEYVHSVLTSMLTLWCPEEPTVCEFILALVRLFPLKLIVLEKKHLQNYMVPSSFDDILYLKVQLQCRSIQKKREFLKILELLDDLAPMNLVEGDIASCMEQTVVCMLEITQRGYSVNLTCVTQILSSKQLFVSASAVESVMKVLAVSHHRDLHAKYIALLKADFVHDCSVEFLTEWTLKWFDEAIHSHGSCTTYYRKEVDELPFIYQHLTSALSAECVTTNDDLAKRLKERALKFMKKISVQNLVDKVFVSDFFENSASQAILVEHLQQCMFQEKMTDAIHNILARAGKSSWLYWSSSRTYSRLYADMLVRAIEMYDFKGTTDYESFFMVLKNSEFWIQVMPLSDQYEYLRTNTTLGKAKQVCKYVGKNLLNSTVSLSFSKELNVSVKDDPKAVTEVIMSSSSEFQKSDLMKALSDLPKASEISKSDGDFLSNILQRLKKAFGDRISDLENAFLMLNKLRAELLNGSNVLISTLFDMSFWGPFGNILKSCKQISAVTESESFWNLCQTLIEQWLSQLVESQTEVTSNPEDDICLLFGEEQAESDSPLVTLKIIEDLSFHGLEKYEDAWRPLFKGQDERIGNICPLVDVKDIDKDILIAEKFFKRPLPEWIKKALYLFSHYFQYSKKLGIIRKVLEILHFKDIDVKFAESIEAFSALEEKCNEDLTLKQLSESGEMLDLINSIVNDELQDIMEELAKSSRLVEFLQETALEDLRNLIDAVEEHSEQSVQESTVSALIDVKRFLSPVIRDQSQKEVEQVLRTLKKSLIDSKITKLDQKISECCTNLHGLKALFHNVANRGEVTKEIVQKAVQAGSRFVLTLSQVKYCDINLTYKTHNKIKTHTDSDIRDLRSRVLLMVNTEAKEKSLVKKQEKLKEDLEKFMQFVDDAISISSTLTQLCQCGHPEFCIGYKVSFFIQELKSNFSELEKKLSLWQTTLAKTRNDYYWLNFFYPEQLRKISNYLKALDSKGESEICCLLSFTGFNLGSLLKGKAIYSDVMKEETSDTFGLKTIGKTLDLLFKDEVPTQTPFPVEKKADANSTRIVDAVQVGQLFIAALNENSDLVVPTLMALYRKTTKFLPKPYQVLFCHEDTLWEDIELLLRRCCDSYKLTTKKQLFTLVCVERLSSEVQYQVVEALQNVAEKPILLAVICRGGAHHPFLDHFSENVHQVQHMSQSAMVSCLQTLWPSVITVTSDVPGQGKSEFIHEMAWSKGMNMCSLHLSGELTSRDLVRKVSDVKMSPAGLLHIDIGILSNPKSVDLLLFQFIVLGFVCHGSDLVKLRTNTICIEVANSISNTLRNSLNIVMNFKREMLKWQNYDNFQPSQEICSPVQVVCHYLDAYDSVRLDNSDLYFTGANACKPLPDERCKTLLRKHFSIASDMSFSILNTFLNVLSDQLKKFSCSYFFRTANISGMLGGDGNLENVKSLLFKALLEVSREFATRSVNACREEQSSSVKNMSSSADLNQSMENLASTSASASAMTKRVEGMIQWAESNHLILAFHNQDIQTLSALYRRKDMVPPHIKKLFESQVKSNMPDFSLLSQKELQKMLQQIARFKPGTTSAELMENIASSYALTPDNLLKMVLIILRTRSRVPVIIMGETGCGKTSLIRYLSNVCGIQLEIHNIHAGIGEDQIIQHVFEVNDKALNVLNDTVWLFLDEINTCHHLGLINTILCHHKCQGRTLSPNLVVMAACNPYKLRSDKSIFTAGLETKVQADEKSRLVYRVNPLPESMVDFVWDYGSLDADDEKAYIRRMIGNSVQVDLVDCVIDILVMSQNFIREREESGSCVSLRDVNRCKKLIEWFKVTLKTKYDMDAKCIISKKVLETRAVVLAIAHSYHSRLPDTSSRKIYRKQLEKIFSDHYVQQTEESIFQIIQDEQSDILNRMELPHGTAKNTALQENVFVIMVCILNHIPVFVVGKPGCSKSLSLQLIKSNLRGKDSKDCYFQSLPQVFCVAYQGSESSTSDGIIKVFEKAERYKEQDKDGSVLPVVILDEIGLAETSRFNPLKVLHSLLEPGDSELPTVAVVGISNWALDAAKMNRAIHLSRPDMDADELFRTGISISEASVMDDHMRMSLSSATPFKQMERKIDEDLIRAIADAYIEYTEKQTFKHFHGLRDFYSLVKYVSKEFISLSDMESMDQNEQLRIIKKGLLRNFGGLSSEIDSVLTIYKTHLESTLSSVDPLFQTETMPSVLDLVKDNIKDKSARHLLLSTRGESALSIIEDLLTDMERNYVTILGSHFEEDLTDEYNYRILSRIILCMEQGVVLILKDLESIYGSLYDMLNQNYTIVGSKKNCRIALGAYSNPLCHVDEDFRCIVLVEEDKMDLSDPPFLNRFEKQHIKLTDLLSTDEKESVSNLEEWIDQIAHIEGFNFGRGDMIPFDSPDMVASLVSFVFSKLHKDLEYSRKLETCKELLLKTCSPESVVRLERSGFPVEEVQKLQEEYLKLPLHSGLEVFLSSILKDDKICLKEIIFTHSNLHTNVADCMNIDVSNCQIEKLGAFKSEKQLCQRIGSFWSHSQMTWLVIQCSPNTDKENILLMKSVVDKEHKEFDLSKCPGDCKHALIIMHMDRNEAGNSLGLVNFLSGWNMSFIDSLERRGTSLCHILHKPKMHLIQERRPLTTFLKQHLFWAFTLIHYHDIPRDLNSLKQVIDHLTSDENMTAFLEDKVSSTLLERMEFDDCNNWQVDVACDRLKLYTHLTLHDALEHEITDCIKHPLAATVYRIEEACSWDAVTLWCDPGDKSKKEIWRNFTDDHTLIDIASVPPPEGPECYRIMDSVLSLRCPFSKLFIERIEKLRDPFLEALRAEYPDFDIDEITGEIKTTLAARFQESVSQAALDMIENSYGEEQFHDYFKDVCNVLFSGIRLQMIEEIRTKVTEWSVMSRFSKGVSFEANVCRLHITCWLYGTIIESELRLVDACLDLTDANVDDILLHHDISTLPALSDSQTNISLLKVIQNTQEEVAEDNETETNNPELGTANVTSQVNDEQTEDRKEQKATEEPTDNEFGMGAVEEHEDTNKSVNDNFSVKVDTENQDVDKSTALVDFVCQQLLPTELLLTNLHVKEWINGVSLVLSLATGVSLESKVFQSLRMCSDFACLVIIPLNLPQSYLCQFGQALKEETIESQVVFDIVQKLVDSLLKTDHVPCHALQHFFACYISSAMAANTESSLLQWTFNILPTLSLYKETYNFFGPTLFQTLLVEIGNADLGEENVLQEAQVLQYLDECITTFKDSGEPDSDLACIVLDILQTHFCNPSFDLNTETLERVLRYDKIFKSDGISLQHLVALAYLKNFLVYFAIELSKEKPLESNTIQKINGLLSIDESESETVKNARTTSLQVFFLKLLSQNSGLKKLEEIVTDYAVHLPFVRAYEMCEEHKLLALELCPFETAFTDIYKKTVAAYDSLQTDSTGNQIKLVFQKSNPDFMYCLFGVALQNVYAVQTIRQLTDSERNDKVKKFYDILNDQLPQNQQCMFRNLCTFGDFSFQLLQTNPFKPPEDHHMAICILHLVSSVLAYNPNYGVVSQKSPFLLRCLQAPSNIKKMFIPGSGFKEMELHMSTLLSARISTNEYAKLSCSCKSLTVIDTTNGSNKLPCDVCKQPLQQDGDPLEISAASMNSKGRQGYAFIDIGCLQSEFTSVRKLSPAAFRVLQFFLHGCLAASLALEFTEQEELSKALNLPESADVRSYINSHLHVHWCAMKRLTEMGDSQLAKLLNFIIKDKSFFIVKDSVQYQSVEQQELYESQFTTYINEVMQKRFQIVQDEVASYHALHPTSSCSQFEVQLAELTDGQNRIGQLPRLLREHVHPLEENMQREFMLQKEVHEYPVMALVFEKMKELSLLQHMMPLVQWHKYVIRYGSHRLKRTDCKTQTVQDFIHGSFQQHQHGNDKSELQNRFETFRKSWNVLKDNSELLRSYNSQLPEMERIHSLTYLENCVIMTKHSGLMQVLIALQAIQNTVLTDAAIICLSTKCLSVTFLKKSTGVAVIPEVHLEHLRKKQVIPQPDLKDALKFSQVNTKFGHGRERQYDMYQIEAQVVDECLLSKPIIRISSSFPMISFSGESLHKTDELFESVIRIVGHEVVDKELKNSVLQLKEKSPSNMQTLLDYLQMTFSLLKRAPVSGSDKNQYLSEFLETWQSLFPRRVKEVDGLCSRVRLTQIISLYEFVEDLVADVIFDGLEEKFRKELPDDCVKYLNGLISNSNIRFQEALLSALKKTVLRYLQSGYANPEDRLSPLLMEKTLWPHGVLDDALSKCTNPEAGLLHKSHFVEHIYGTIIFLTEAVEEKKIKEEKKSTLFQPVQKNTDKIQQRKKRAIKFRK